MSDTYISREAVIIAMCHKMCNMKEPCAFNCPEYNLLKSFPAADVRPVVWCKDCKHCFVDGDNVRFNVCELNHNRVQADDWFCADGERKDGAE